mgnify:CR=1 FL=1
MPGPVLLIAGGYDKHSDYSDWAKEFSGRVKYLVLIGQTRDRIAACAGSTALQMLCMRRIFRRRCRSALFMLIPETVCF